MILQVYRRASLSYLDQNLYSFPFFQGNKCTVWTDRITRYDAFVNLARVEAVLADVI